MFKLEKAKKYTSKELPYATTVMVSGEGHTFFVYLIVNTLQNDLNTAKLLVIAVSSYILS